MDGIRKVEEAFSAASTQFNEKIDQTKQKQDLLNKLKQEQPALDNVKQNIINHENQAKELLQPLRERSAKSLNDLQAWTGFYGQFNSKLTPKLKTFLNNFEAKLNGNADDAQPVMDLIISLKTDLNSLREEYNDHPFITKEASKIINNIEKVKDKILFRDSNIKNRDRCKQEIASFKKDLEKLEKISDSYPKEFLKALLSAVKTFFKVQLWKRPKSQLLQKQQLKIKLWKNLKDKNRQKQIIKKSLKIFA